MCVNPKNNDRSGLETNADVALLIYNFQSDLALTKLPHTLFTVRGKELAVIQVNPMGALHNPQLFSIYTMLYF